MAKWTPIPERFWPKVDKNGPIPPYRPDLGSCWIWTAYINPSCGYGGFSIKNRCRLAHKVSWMLAGRSVPDGMTLDHLCRVRHCVNPSHLEVVTSVENVLRGMSPNAINARKTHCARGGHLLNGKNLLRHKRRNGKVGRECRMCHNELARARWKRRTTVPVDKASPAAGG